MEEGEGRREEEEEEQQQQQQQQQQNNNNRTTTTEQQQQQQQQQNNNKTHTNIYLFSRAITAVFGRPVPISFFKVDKNASVNSS